jgi:two-component system cell cycle sensor histidine kinase/response regulator CckA
MRNLKGLGIVLFALAAVIPVVVLFVLIQALGKGGGERQAEEAQSKLAAVVRAQVEGLIESSLQEAKNLKGHPQLVDPKMDPKVVKEELKRLKGSAFGEASVINGEGGVDVTTISSEPRSDSSPWLRRSLQEGRPFVSYPTMNGNSEVPGYSVYQPLKPKGDADGRVLRLDFSFDRIGGILDGAKPDSGQELYLIDSGNNTLYSKDKAEILKPFTKVTGFSDWVGAEGGKTMATADGGKCFVQTVRPKDLMDDKQGWLLVWTGGGQGVGSTGMLPILTAVAAIVGMGLAVLLAMMMVGKLRDPIVDVTDGLEAAAMGDLKVELEPKGVDETTALAKAFNEMVENVRTQKEALEKKVEENSGVLRESKEKLDSAASELRAAFEAIRDAVVMVDLDGKVIEANQHFCDLSVLSLKDLKTYSAEAVVDQLRTRFKNADGFGKQWQHFIDNPRMVGNDDWLTPGASPLTIEVRTVPVLSSADEVMGRVWVFRDVSEVKSLDMQLRQSQKMGALGNLAASVAHDFNNMLTGISGNVSFAMLKLSEGETDNLGDNLESAIEACEKSAVLVRQLLEFSREKDVEEMVVSCDVKKVVQETAMLLSRALDPRLKLEVQIDDGVWPVRGDGNQLQQVLMNMCVNAGDAILEDGTIRLEAVNRVKVKTGGETGSRSGEFVELSIADDGEGMVDEIRERIFEPFFTTKAQGEGTGLGLATCLQIIEKLGGWIDCESELALGTTFRIFLPRSRKAVGGAEVADIDFNFDELADGFRDGEGAGMKALVVDDEESVRDVAANILREEGYEVLTADNGEEAVKIVQQEEGNLAVVVLDLTMPVMSGRDAFVQMRDEYPDLPVIICSGYLMGIVDFVSELGHEPDDKVQKPYRLNVLRNKIKQVVAKRQEASGGGKSSAKSGEKSSPDQDVPVSAS